MSVATTSRSELPLLCTTDVLSTAPSELTTTRMRAMPLAPSARASGAMVAGGDGVATSCTGVSFVAQFGVGSGVGVGAGDADPNAALPSVRCEFGLNATAFATWTGALCTEGVGVRLGGGVT